MRSYESRDFYLERAANREMQKARKAAGRSRKVINRYFCEMLT